MIHSEIGCGFRGYARDAATGPTGCNVPSSRIDGGRKHAASCFRPHSLAASFSLSNASGIPLLLPFAFAAWASMPTKACASQAATLKTQRRMTDLLDKIPLFHEIPGNPPPENAAGGFFTTHDRKKIRYGLFAAVARPMKGTVVVLDRPQRVHREIFRNHPQPCRPRLWRCHLRLARPGRFRPADQRPQRGYVRSFFDYTSDLEQFFEEIVLPDCRGPYYILAHSAGAVITLLAAPSMVNRVRRMVLIAPFLAVPDLPVSTTTVRRLCSLFCLAGPWQALCRLGSAAQKNHTLCRQQGDIGSGAVSAQHAASTKPIRNWRSAARRSAG